MFGRRRKQILRDDRGRFAAHDKTVYVDEYGDMGRNGDPFVMTAMVTDDPDRFHRMGNVYRAFRGTRLFSKDVVMAGKLPNGWSELKFKNTSDWMRIQILRSVDRAGPRIYTLVADKNSKMFARMKGKDIYEACATELMRAVKQNTRGITRVYFDSCSLLKNPAATRACSVNVPDSRCRMSLGSCRCDSSKSPSLQINDFVTGAEGYYHMNMGKPGCGRFHREIESRTKTVMIRKEKVAKYGAGVRPPAGSVLFASQYMQRRYIK